MIDETTPAINIAKSKAELNKLRILQLECIDDFLIANRHPAQTQEEENAMRRKLHDLRGKIASLEVAIEESKKENENVKA